MKIINILILVMLSNLSLANEIKADSKRITIPFTISATNHILIELKINNKPANFIVDTAAGASVINTKYTKALKLRTVNTNATAAGLGTSSTKVKLVQPFAIFVANSTYKTSSFVALDLKHVEVAANGKKMHGLIGGPFLQKYGAIIDYEKRTISLKKAVKGLK